MNLLITEEEFKSLKWAEKAPLLCKNCNQVFHRAKRNILSKRTTNEYCSSRCSLDARDGRVETQCYTCKSTIFRRRSSILDKVFCSSSCAAKTNNSIKPKRSPSGCCKLCGDPIYSRHRYCSSCRKEKSSSERLANLTLGEFKTLYSEIHVFHGRLRQIGRLWHKDKLKQPCSICGYAKHVELAHIKPISQFPLDALIKDVHADDNVTVLCPNCHWEFDKSPA